MIDPVILGVVSCAVISLVVFLAYFFSSKEESDFEKAFNGNALMLLNDTKKEKNKQQKPKENKKKKDKEDKKKEPQDVEKKEKDHHEQQVEKKVEKRDVVPVKSAQKSPAEKPLKIVTKEEQQQEEESKKIETTSVESVSDVADVAAPVEVEQITPHLSSSEIKETVQKQEKKRSPRPINHRDLDLKKVVSRLTNEGIEQDYIQFLTTYFKDTDLQKSNLTSEVKAIQKKLNESTQKVEKLTKEKTVLENRFKDEQAKNVSTTAKYQQLQLHETDIKKQLLSLQVLTQRNEFQYINESASMKNQLMQYENELTILRSANQKLAKEVKAASMKVPESELRNLRAEFSSFEKVASAVKDELEKKKRQCDDLKTDLVKTTRFLEKMDNEKREWQKKEHQITTEYHSLKQVMNDMKREINQYVEYKQEKEALIEELKRREAEHQKEKKKMVEIPKNEPVAVEETVILKKTTTDLASAPTTSTNEEEYKRVVEEKKQLQAKVDELRARNIAILEKVEEEAGKQKKNDTKTSNFDVEGERKKVVQVVSKLTGNSFNQVEDTKAYTKWLQESVSNVQKELAKAKKTAEAAPVVEVVRREEKKETKEDASYYRNVLQSLLVEIGNIEKLASKQEAEYEATISKLKSRN